MCCIHGLKMVSFSEEKVLIKFDIISRSFLTFQLAFEDDGNNKMNI
jgi:hypothetical protein